MAPQTRSMTKKITEAKRICPRYDHSSGGSIRITRSLVQAMHIFGKTPESVPASIRRHRRRNTINFNDRTMPKTLTQRRQTDQATEIWCICREREFGTMIACDGPTCTIEWFHLRCIGVQQIPEGQWFCPNCAALRNNFNN